MNFPRYLNPFHGTGLGWLFPLTWRIIMWVVPSVPTGLEVFLHHRFGCRSGVNLIKGFFLLIFMAHVLRKGYPTPTVSLFPGFIFAYGFAAAGHWLTSQTRPERGQVHSYSSGQPWPLWRRLPLASTTVERYLEPVLCCFLATLLWLFDPALAHWLTLVAVALFVKGQVRRARLRSRRLEALDQRVETNLFAPRPRAEEEPFVEARPAPPTLQWRPRHRPGERRGRD